MAELAELSQGRAGLAFLATNGGVDEALPLLERLLKPQTLQIWWKERMDPDSPLGRCRPVRVEALRYRPGRRCTFIVSLQGPAGAAVYLKLYRKRKARCMGRLLTALPRISPGAGLAWPQLLREVPGEGVLVLGEVPGTALENLLQQKKTCGRVIRVVADGLARFHGLHAQLPPHALPHWGWEDEVRVIRGALGPLASHPQVGARQAGEVLGSLEAALERAPFSPAVLLHRDLHPQQVLLERQRMGLVDLDQMALGAPEIDLGNLMAHLDLAGLHLAADADHFALLRDELAVTYARRAPLSRLALEVAQAAALFRLAAVHGGRPAGRALLKPLLDGARRCLGRGSP